MLDNFSFTTDVAMAEFLSRMKSIQNTQRSLGWGYDISEDGDSIVICVYHRIYKQVRFFWMPCSCLAIYDLMDKMPPDNKTLLFSATEPDVDGMIKAVQKQLKKWFPSKWGGIVCQPM